MTRDGHSETPNHLKMKTLKTILREIDNTTDPYEDLADAQRSGEISLAIYIRACAAGDGLSREEALEALRENYRRASRAHLCPV